MDNLYLPNHFRLPLFNIYSLIAVLCISVVAFFRKSGRQRLVPNVPIVGLDEIGNIAKARKRFRHDSKAMLLEGYHQVFYTHDALSVRG